ncbi:MAG: branched-chain amino acid ABC transporter permease [Alphaproteobacteria bacterium]|nr:branched-chain amino acid ABC transporter permease [Alphaproteobacteria bacterium]
MPTRPLLTRYVDDLKLFPDLWHKVGWVATIGIAIAWPIFANARWMAAANLALVAIVGSVGLMILTGFAGQISLGHAAFLAVGAYTCAVLGEQLHLPFWLAIPAGGFVAAAVGLAVGPFALRLRGLYLAIVTLGLLFLVNHTLLSLPEYTHGSIGIAVPMHTWFTSPEGTSSLGDFAGPTTIAGVSLSFTQKLYGLYLGLAGAAAWLGANVRRSRAGRAMVAVRDSDLAASALGVDPARTKVLAFGVSSFLGGVAGGMFAYQQQYITVEPPFDLNMSVQYIAMCVLGGVGTTFGAVAGALAFVLLTPLAEIVGRELPLLSSLSSAQQSTLLFSLLVVGFLVFEPLGLFGIWLRVKRYFIAWPFRY